MSVERSNFRMASPTEYRAAGRFSGEEVRELLHGGRDMRSLGAPEELLIRVLEHRDAKRRALTGTTDADRRRDAEKFGRMIEADRLAGRIGE